MRVTWKLTVASLKMYLRQREAIIWSIVLPLLMIVVFGLIRFDSLGHIDLGIVNEAGEGGKGLIASLTAMKTFNVMEGERESELKALERGDRDIVLAIPASFGAADHDAAPVAYENDARMQQAQLGSLLVQRVLDEKTIAEAHPLHRPMLESRLVKSRNLTTFDFILPGILAMSIMQMGIFGVAFNFVDLKKRGILRRLSVTPINPQNFIVAQVLTRLIVMVAQVVIMVGVGMIFFHLHFIGNPALLMFVALLGLMAAASVVVPPTPAVAVGGLTTTPVTWTTVLTKVTIHWAFTPG